MQKNLIRIFVIACSLVVGVSCASKKKAGSEVAVDDGSPDAAISSQPMGYDAMGSDSGTIQGLSTIYFDYDQAALSSEARRQLAANAEWVKSNTGVSIQVEGHCDSRGTVEYNLALGERRAKAVKGYLVSLGIDAKRLSIISYGKEKPMVQGDTEEAYSKNRRANFVPLPK